MTEQKEEKNKTCPPWLRWPWNVVIYVVLALVLRIFAIPFIILLIVLQNRYSPHGAAEGYCLSRTRRRLVWLIPRVILLAFGGVAIYLTITVAPAEEVQERLMVGGMGALSLLIGACLSVVAVRDACFPAHSKLARSIRAQLPFPDEAPGMAELFAMVDNDLAQNGMWFGPVGVGKEWVLGSQASYTFPGSAASLWWTGSALRDRGRTGVPPGRWPSSSLMTDGSAPGLTPQELRAAADTRRGATRSTSKFLYLDEEAQEQFLQEKRRRQGTRTAAESQSARRAEMQRVWCSSVPTAAAPPWLPLGSFTRLWMRSL